MTIVYLEVKPHKLSNRELAKVFETLKRQGQVTNEEDRKLNTQLGKAYYVRTNHRYVTIRILQSKLEAFVERTKIDDADIKTVRGGISRDLTALEQQLEEDEAAPNYVYPSLPLEATGDVNNSILKTIEKMDSQSYNLEENTKRDNGMNVSISTPYDPDEDATDLGNLSMIPGEANQNSVDPGEGEIAEIEEKENSSNDAKIPVMPVGSSGESDQPFVRLDAGLSIPIWMKGKDRQEEILYTRMFIRDLQRLKSLGVLKNEALLINATLVKSERTELYEELPAEAETSVDEFAKYLKKAYGMNRFDMMKEVQNIKQRPTENPHAFLSRVITMFYEAKGKTKKPIDEIKTNEEETYEIVGLFWKGLYDERVRIILKQRMDELNIEDLASITKNIESSYNDAQRTAVNMINDQIGDITEEGNVFHIKRNKNQHYNGRSNRRTSYRHLQCYCCGKIGHKAEVCWHNEANQRANEESPEEQS